MSEREGKRDTQRDMHAERRTETPTCILLVFVLILAYHLQGRGWSALVRVQPTAVNVRGRRGQSEKVSREGERKKQKKREREHARTCEWLTP